MAHSTSTPRLPFSGKIEALPFEDECCWPTCQRRTEVIDAPLCKAHLIKVYVICQETYLWALEPQPGTPAVRPPASKRHAPLPEEGHVYFVQLGSLVKIGFTTDMDQRMRDVPHERILGTKPGTMQDERRCHAAFAHLRVTGEWFRAQPELLTFIADVAAEETVVR